MKKLCLLVLVCCFLMVGCVPDGFTENEYSSSKKVVKIIDDYLSTDIEIR